MLTVNAFYNYTPMRLLDGTRGIIPAIDQQGRRLILDHQEIRTTTQTYTLDLNYGLTEGSRSRCPTCAGSTVTSMS